MERVLHRVNSPSRLRRGIAARFDRAEVDLRYRRGRFVLSHDVPMGPWTLGRSGAEFVRSRFPPIHRKGRLARLAELIDGDAIPLLIDLKGRWPRRGLAHLAESLRLRGRDEDAVASNHRRRLDRFGRIDPNRTRVYGLNRRRTRRLIRRLDPDDAPRAVSIDAALLDGRPGLLDALTGANVAVYVWNIGRPDALTPLKRAGVAGAIFDDTGWVAAAGPRPAAAI